MVHRYVRDRQREIRVEAGHLPAETFIPQSQLPGQEAEVDFGEAWIRLRGQATKCTVFSLWLSC